MKHLATIKDALDFLNYQNAYKWEMLHNQPKVVIAAIDDNGNRQFYAFFITMNMKPSVTNEWLGYFTDTPDNVMGGLNQNGVEMAANPVREAEVSATKGGFDYFIKPTKTKQPGGWGWTVRGDSQDALAFLNGEKGYHYGKPVEFARLAGFRTQQGGVGFYVFYR